MFNFLKPRPKKEDVLYIVKETCIWTAKYMKDEISKDMYDKLLLSLTNDFLFKFGN
jgi:hypothetical protein